MQQARIMSDFQCDFFVSKWTRIALEAPNHAFVLSIKKRWAESKSSETESWFCPSSWYVPSDSERTELAEYLSIPGYNADGKLKETGTGCWKVTNGDVCKESGFATLQRDQECTIVYQLV